MDPFLVESQVYDFLIEKNWVGEVGPHCYGWLTIDEDQERLLDNKISPKHEIFEWRRREDTENEPVRALLLEYIDGCTLDVAYITPRAARSLRDQLNSLHSLNIAHGDFYPRNIMVSKMGRAYIIDFSAAVLWPLAGRLRKKEKFQKCMQDENQELELFLFRLQNVSFHRNFLLFSSLFIILILFG